MQEKKCLKSILCCKIGVVSAVDKLSKAAFTLSEVLITLGIIGIVAAITMPLVINKIQDQQYDRAREKARATIGEAGRILAIQGDISNASSSEDFVKGYLSKKLSIAKYCDSENLEDCGLVKKIQKFNDDTEVDMPTTIGSLASGNKSAPITKNHHNDKSYGFVTANGYSVNLFYNPDCIPINKEGGYSADYVCMNAIYDMNGLRGPNKVGKDIGYVSVIYPDETSVAVAPAFEAQDLNARMDWVSANNSCNGKGLTLPSKEELFSSAYNQVIVKMSTATHYWSASSYYNDVRFAWAVDHSLGLSGRAFRNTSYLVRCVRR